MLGDTEPDFARVLTPPLGISPSAILGFGWMSGLRQELPSPASSLFDRSTGSVDRGRQPVCVPSSTACWDAMGLQLLD